MIVETGHSEPRYEHFADGADNIVVLESNPDELGRQTWTSFRVGLVGPAHETVGIRAQVFRAVLADHVDRPALDGREVSKVWTRGYDCIEAA